MNRFFFLLLLLSAAFPGRLHAQACPPNLGFERGNWDGWQAFFGSASTVNGSNIIQIHNWGLPSFAVQELMWRGVVGDMDGFGRFPTVCPYGGEYSARIGDDIGQQEVHGLSYTFTVPNDTFQLTYYYAVVIRQGRTDGGGEEPRFKINTTDLLTNAPVPCGNMELMISGVTGDWLVGTRGTNYKPWKAASIDLRGMRGRRIRIDFTVADCTLNGNSPPHDHFCYAYIDFASNCIEQIGSASICNPADSLVLQAPPGYGEYTWFNSTFSTLVGYGSSLTLRPVPPAGTVFYCDLNPHNSNYGCRDTLRVEVKPAPVPDTVKGARDFYYCVGQLPSPLLLMADSGHYLQWWASAAGGIPSLNLPIPSTATVGTRVYWVSQKRPFGCDGPRRPVVVHIKAPEPVTFSVNALRQCLDQNRFVFHNTTPLLGSGYFYWTFNNLPMQLSDSNYLVKQFDTAGTIHVTLMMLGAARCSGRADTDIIVVPRPRAGFTVPGGFCFGLPTVSFQDASTTTGAAITGFWWNIEGNTYNTASVTLPAPLNGTMTIQHASVSAEGCRSDTLTQRVKKEHPPVAGFSWNGHCENEPVQFTDASHYAPGITGAPPITGWHWSYDSVAMASVQHPALILASGNHRMQLVAEGATGCLSAVLDTPIHIDQAPYFDFSYNDSCLRHDIRFTARDFRGTAQHWEWDFGTGRGPGSAIMFRRFLTEGLHRVTLYAGNAVGCKDTFSLLLPLHEVRAVAGHDTLATIGESVQLYARGDSGTRYSWSPALGLSDPHTADPVATLDRDQRYTLYAVDSLGCDRATDILIRRFIGPGLYVPNAFTPNGDGRNDLLRVIAVGIRDFHYLAIYDRWGGLVFRSTDRAQGWDGILKGKALGSQTFVWIAEGTDYTGRRLLRKGTVTIVR